MVNLLARDFRKTPASITSFDFTDIASGTGYVVFKGGKGQSDYNLNQQEFYSDKITTFKLESITNVWETTQDIDFDVLLNNPLTMRGKAIISVPIGVQSRGGTSSGFYLKYTAYIRKWDGTTETEIVSGTSEELVWTIASSNIRDGIKTVNLEVPLTKFKKGETIRLTIVLEAKSEIEQNYNVGIAHDPKNRNDDPLDATEQIINDTTDTILNFHAPFRIDR